MFALDSDLSSDLQQYLAARNWEWVLRRHMGENPQTEARVLVGTTDSYKKGYRKVMNARGDNIRLDHSILTAIGANRSDFITESEKTRTLYFLDLTEDSFIKKKKHPVCFLFPYSITFISGNYFQRFSELSCVSHCNPT